MSENTTNYRQVVSSSGADVLRIVARPPQPIRMYPRPRKECFGEDGRPVERLPDAPRSEQLEPEISALEEHHYLGLSLHRRITVHAPHAAAGSSVAVRVNPDESPWASVRAGSPGQVKPLPPDDLGTGDSASSTSDREDNNSENVVQVDLDENGIGACTLHIERSAFLRAVDGVDPTDTDAWRERAEVHLQAAESASAFEPPESGSEASEDATLRDLRLVVQCNAATSLDALLERRGLLVDEQALSSEEASAPEDTEDNPQPPSSSMVAMVQEALNQIVTRHGAAEVQFIPENGDYRASTGTSVRELLAHFGREEEEAFAYADANFGIQLDDSVADYVRRTYGVDAPATSGAVMDRRLLFGTDDAWTPGDPVEDLDGLISLRTNLIGRFFEQIDAQAAPYLNADTFWLHRPEHSPYQPATEIVVAEGHDLLRNEPVETDIPIGPGGLPVWMNAQFQDTFLLPPQEIPTPHRRAYLDGPFARDGAGRFAVVSEGDRLSVHDHHDEDGTTWYNVPVGPVTGWICEREGGVTIVPRDRVHEQNHGTYGGPGMAYSWGCKDRPAPYANMLEESTPGPDAIQSWRQYQDGYKPGKTGDDNDTVHWRGIDCSGFVQNVLTDARLWDGETPIVSREVLTANRTTHDPEALRKLHNGEDGWETKWPHSYTRSAASFVAENADGDPFDPCTRTIPFDKTSRDTAYLNKGDVIANEGHVVIVGEEAPEVTDGTHEKFGYTIYHARGGVEAFLKEYNENGHLVRDTDDTVDSFVRKVMATPMAWWWSGIIGDWIDARLTGHSDQDDDSLNQDPPVESPTATPGRVLFWR